MPSLNSYFSKDTKTTVEAVLTKKMHPQNVSYKKLEESAFQYRNIPQEDVEKLADLIEMDGEVLQPLLVRKKGADTFEILAGHKRYKACKYLTEVKGQPKFSFIPCYVKEMSDAQAEFAVYSTNGYNKKTDYEIMREVEGMARLVKENPEAFPEATSGRLVEKLAAIMGMSKTTVQEYKTISNHLGDKAMGSFKEGKISKEAAKVLATVPNIQQENIVAAGVTKADDIKASVQTGKPIRLPSKKDIENAYNHLIAYYNPAVDGDIAEYFKESAGKSHEGYGGGNVSFGCTPRGITIRNTDEMTWKTFVKQANEYGFVHIKEKELDEKILGNDEQQQQEEDDNLPGQMSINDVIGNTTSEDIVDLAKENENTATNVVRPDNAVEYENNVLEKTRAKQLEGVILLGKCPLCGKGVFYPSNKNYCGYCGKSIIWSKDWLPKDHFDNTIFN